MIRPGTLLLLLSLLAISTKAQYKDSVYIVDKRIQVHDLNPYISVFADKTNELTVTDIRNLSDSFLPLANYSEPAEPYISYWLKISIASIKPIDKWWLMFGDTSPIKVHANNNFVDVWRFRTSDSIHQRTGVAVKASERSIRNKPGIDRVYFSSKAGERQEIYVKIYNQFSLQKLPTLELRNPVIGILGDGSATYTYVLCAIAAFFCIMAFFFFFFVREKAYLYFALYTFTLSQHYLIINPDLPFVELYIPEYPQLVLPLFMILTAGGFLLFLLFGRHFINLPQLSKKLDRLIVNFVRIGFIIVVAESIATVILQRYPLDIRISLFLMVIIFAIIIRFGFFKTVLARFFVAGALWLVVFTVLGLLWESYLPWLPFNPWPVGQMGQLLIYSAGLAYKVRLNERARAEADRIKGLDDIKSKFFANISHEFRTPLTLIQGPLQQIEENADGKSGSIVTPIRHIKTMRRHTDRLLELVNQLLDLSKLDSGKMKLQIIKGDVVQMLRVLTGSFESMAERKSIHYYTQFPEQTLIGFFDKDKLDKIVCNLLGNAFKYTPEKGTVSVTVTTEEDRLRITVEDSGDGIPRVELDKVFDRFYQVEGNEDKGSGIGLALVKELVDLYRGQITVSSEPGKGSRFRVSLPINKKSFSEDEFVYGEWKSAEAVVLPVSNENTDAVAKPVTNLELPLVLLVEDNGDLRDFIKETIQNKYQVIEAVNGRDGFEKAIAHIPDLIISDVMMPVMNGIALVEKVKKDEHTSHIPVILLTAKAGQEQKVQGLQTGADDYLTKPFDASELLTRMHNLIQQRKLLRRKFSGDITLKPSEVSVISADDVFLQKVMVAIEKNISEETFSVELLATEVNMSRSQLHRKLIALTGQSASDVIRQTRLQRAKQLLEKRSAIPSEVAYQVGFNSHTYFSKCFKEEFGVSPSEVGR